MPNSASQQIQATLTAGREDADRVLGDAERNADVLTALAGDADRALLQARLERMTRLNHQLANSQRRIALANATMAEAMAVTALRLAEIAREADFSIPPWPAGIDRTVEIKLAETREVTFRIETRGTSRGDAPPQPI